MKHNAIWNDRLAGRQTDKQTEQTSGNLALPMILIAKCKGAYLDL
jgi:hypothetical protein